MTPFRRDAAPERYPNGLGWTVGAVDVWDPAATAGRAIAHARLDGAAFRSRAFDPAPGEATLSPERALELARAAMSGLTGEVLLG